MVEIESGVSLTDHELAEAVVNTKETIARLRRALVVLESTIQQRIEATGGRELMDDQYRMALEPGTPSYDYGLLRALLEAGIPQPDLDKAFAPAHDETVQVADRWNGTQLNSLEKRFGGHVAEIIQRARIPGASRLVVEKRKDLQSAGGRHG